MTRALSTAEFEDLVDRHHLGLVRLAFGMCGDRAMAEDAVQACWHAAWRGRLDIRQPDRIQGWLYTVTANEVRRQLRRQRTLAILRGRLMPPSSPEIDPRHSDLARAMTRLAPPDRQLVVLKYGLGQTSEEIGAQLGLSAPGTRRRLQAVLEKLRRDLREDPANG